MAQQKAVDPAADEVDDLIDELQPGAKLLKGQYTITSYLNSGGFGITYLAKDSLDRDVVIKECFPSSVCRRSKVMVAARSRAHTAELRSVIQLFVREARNLAKIVHPNIVSVHNVFEDNGTAYMALDYIDGMDLQQIIDGEGQSVRPTPEQIVEITSKLVKAVGFIHKHDMLHRDISPDNVLITKSGEPILIDFGAAREKASQTNRAMSALRVVKDGYSPQEFYIAGSEQGPWSDLYALGATLYHVITGEAPVNGQARLGALAEDRPDPYTPLTGRFQGYPNGFLEAIDRALNTLPKQRLQSADDWLAMIGGEGSAPVSGSETEPVMLSEPEPGTDDAVQRLVSDFQRDAALKEPATKAEIPSVPAMAKAASRSGQAPVATRASQGKGTAQILSGVALAVVLVAGGYVMLGGPATETKPIRTEANATAAPTPEAAPTTPTETAAATPDATPATPLVTADATETPIPAPDAATVGAAAPADASEAAASGTAAGDAPALTDATEAADPEAAAAGQDPTTEAAAAAAPAPVEEPASAETAATEPSPAAPVGTPAANQVGFAAWDAVLPFSTDDRIIGGKPYAIVLRLAPNVDLTETGDWLEQGLLIASVNGIPTPTSDALTAAILNAMQVDPDGKARMVVEYLGSDLEPKSGLLTVGAVRLVSLSNGVTVRTLVVDGAWRSEVSGVTQPQLTSLRQGDILFRDKTTGTPLDTSDALEKIMADLVDRDITQTEFSIVRDSRVSAATMQLSLEAEQ